jgi:phosphate:Na+ symporter
MVQCGQESLSDESAERVYSLIRVVGELERIGDNCYNLIVLAGRRHDKKIKIRNKALEEFHPYAQLVWEFLQFVAEQMDKNDSEQTLARAFDMEGRINAYRDDLKKQATRRMSKRGHVKAELLYIDILRHVEQIGDHALNIAQAMRGRQLPVLTDA